MYLISSNVEYKSVYKDFNNEKFIITDIEYKDYGLKLELKGKEKVIGYLYEKNNKLMLGDIIVIKGKKLEITNNTVPNTFNYKKYLNSNKIYNVIETKSIKKIKSSSNIFYKLKNKLLDRSLKFKSKAYIETLIFGDNSSIDEDVLNSYRNNGISHLFAISGLHIAIFLYVLSFIMNKFSLSNGFKNTIFIIFLSLFMFITNFTMSIIRASIFTILLIFNKSLKLEIDTKNILFLTLFIICLNNHLALNNIGLLYSFIVTLFLILYKDSIKGNYIKKLFIVSLLAFISSYPITVSNFYEINFLQIIYNIFFVPFVSFIILPLVLITYLISPLDSVLNFFVLIFEKVSLFLEDIKIFKLSVCKMSCIVYMLYYVELLVIKCKFKRKLLISFTLVIIMFLFSNTNVFKDNYYILFFDVGQGDSAFVKLNKENILIDTGGITTSNNSKYTYKLSKNRIIPYLKSCAEKQVDTLVLTHGDFDHIGEAEYIIRNFTVKRVIFNNDSFNSLEKDLIKVLEEKNVKYYRNIEELEVEETKLYFLNTRMYDNENDNSNVIYFEFNNKKFLLMGDAGIEKENDILDKYNISDIDVLKIGHHGSDTSSSREFINRVNPKNSVISVGKDNRYGHPKDEVLNNLKYSKIYRTDIDGSIMFKIKDNSLKVEIYAP